MAQDDLIHLHVQKHLNQHPEQQGCIQRQAEGLYIIHGRTVKVGFCAQQFLVVHDGPLRQPFSDYMAGKDSTAIYNKKGLKKSALHNIPKEERISFGDEDNRFNRLDAMKIAKEQAKFREYAAHVRHQGQAVPSDIMEAYEKTIEKKLGTRRLSKVEAASAAPAWWESAKNTAAPNAQSSTKKAVPANAQSPRASAAPTAQKTLNSVPAPLLAPQATHYDSGPMTFVQSSVLVPAGAGLAGASTMYQCSPASVVQPQGAVFAKRPAGAASTPAQLAAAASAGNAMQGPKASPPQPAFSATIFGQVPDLLQVAGMRGKMQAKLAPKISNVPVSDRASGPLGGA
jgi:hypothetical protein